MSLGVEIATQAQEGKIMQRPPAFSAIKIDGKRAYRFAREKEEVEIPAREVHIHEFEIQKAGVPETSFRVLCSKGGAYLKDLRRTRIGPYHVDDAMSIQEFERQLQNPVDEK